MNRWELVKKWAINALSEASTWKSPRMHMDAYLYVGIARRT
jgi:hypothetical protein